MLLLEARRDLSRTVLTVCLGYVLALHLIIAGLASTSQTVRSLDALLSLDQCTRADGPVNVAGPYCACLLRIKTVCPSMAGWMALLAISPRCSTVSRACNTP